MFGLQEALLESSEQSHLLQFCSMVVRALNCWELICVLPLDLKPLKNSFLGGVHTAFSRRQFYLLNYEQCIFSNIYVCSSIFSCKYDKTQLVSSFSLSVFFCMTLFFLKIRLHFSSVCTVFPPPPPSLLCQQSTACEGNYYNSTLNLHLLLNNSNWHFFFFWLHDCDMTDFLFDLQHLNIKTLTDDVVRQLMFCFGFAKLITLLLMQYKQPFLLQETVLIGKLI